MTVRRAYAIVAGSAAAGGALGYVLAKVLPAYYRRVFADGHDPDFDPVAVGLALGIGQGAIAGVVVGSVVVLTVARTEARRGKGDGL